MQMVERTLERIQSLEKVFKEELNKKLDDLMIMISKRFQISLSAEILPSSIQAGAEVLPQISDLQEAEEHPELDAKKGIAVVGKITATPLEEISVEDGPLGYTSK